MSGNERFRKFYEEGKEVAPGGFITAAFFRYLEGPCEYPGTCNIFGILTAIFALISLIGLILLIIGFIGKEIYKNKRNIQKYLTRRRD